MSIQGITTDSSNNFYCCSWKTTSQLTAIAMAITGVVAAIFMNSLFAATGFTLFGLSIIYFCSNDVTDEIQQSLVEKTNQISQLSLQNRLFESEIRQLRGEKEELIRSNEEYSSENEIFANEVREWKTERHTLNMKIHQLSGALSQAENAAQKNITWIQGEMFRLQQMNDYLRDEDLRIKQDRQTLQNEQTLLKAEQESQIHQQTEMLKERQAVINETITATEKLQELSEEITRRIEEVKKLNQEIETKKTELGKLS